MDINIMDFNPFTKIGKEWALVSAGNAEKSNMMTVSWGGVGVLWGKNVVFLFIRESRYTKEFIDNGETFSLSFFDEKYHEALALCGSKSGRDMDKWQAAGLTPLFDGTVVYPKEANLVLKCRKLSAMEIPVESFIDADIESKWYGDHDMHTMYIGEIIEAV